MDKSPIAPDCSYEHFQKSYALVVKNSENQNEEVSPLEKLEMELKRFQPVVTIKGEGHIVLALEDLKVGFFVGCEISVCILYLTKTNLVLF